MTFLDTNVIIGFVFQWDPWHAYAVNLFNKSRNNHWSNNVEFEVKNKIQSLKIAYSHFLSELLNNLKKDTFINKKHFIKIAKKISQPNTYRRSEINNTKIANILWEVGGWYDEASSNELIDLIDEFFINLSFEVSNNFDICKAYLNEPFIRTLKYKSILDSLKNISIGENKIHYPDDIILIDAHHLAKEKIINKFVTSDFKLLKFEKFIKEYTDIPELVNLNKFNF